MRNSPSLIALASLFAMVQAPLASHASSEPKLEVFSWWTSGGEAAALDALFNSYKRQYAGVEIVNATVAGAAEARRLEPFCKLVCPAVIHPTAGKPIPVGNCLVSTWNPVIASRLPISTRLTAGINRFRRSW